MRAPRARRPVASLTPYALEESSEHLAARLGIDVAGVVRFDTNTVPWTLASPSGALGLALNEYPDTSYAELVAEAATHCAVAASRVVPGAGADELITMIATAYLERGRTFAHSDPTYPLFAVASLVTGATPLPVPVRDDLRPDVDGLAVAAARATVTWLANPDNPTGALLSQDELRYLARCARGLLVVDEAYAELAGESAVAWAHDARNVVVLRTLSKAFGLAGMRVGYAVAGDAVMRTLMTVRPVNSISVVSAHLGVEALRRRGELPALVASLCAERARLAAALRDQGRAVVEGAANFVLADASPADGERALARGLVMRTYQPGHRLHGRARITVRTPSDDDRLIEVLGQG